MLEINRLHHTGLFHVDGSYADFLQKRDDALSNQAAYQDSLAGLVRREVAWLRRGAKARTSKSKARIQSAESSMGELAEARGRSSGSTIGIEFSSSGRKTKRLWSGEDVKIGFPGKTQRAGRDRARLDDTFLEREQEGKADGEAHTCTVYLAPGWNFPGNSDRVGEVTPWEF